MRLVTLFIVLGTVAAACSAPTTPKPPPQLPVAATPDAASAVTPVPVDAAPTFAVGSACSRETGCGEGLMCGPLPGGYCTTFCGNAGGPCSGTCVETVRAGEVCMATCTSNADCRAAEGYVCDPTWKACMMPGSAALVAKSCPAPQLARDAAFGAPAQVATSASPGLYQFEPATALLDDGGLAVVYTTRGRMMEGNVLGAARIDAAGAVTPDLPFATGRKVNFDPWMARGAKQLYAVWLGMDGRGQDPTQQVGLAISKDRGATWSAPVAVHEPADCKDGEPDCLDKPMVVVGAAAGARPEIVYVLYSADGLRVRASRDGGATFGPAVTALSGIYGNAVVGSDGRLHVVTLNGGPMGAFGSADQKVEYTVSSDGGASFAKPLTVSGHEESVPFFFSNPSVAVDDRRGYVYIAYTRGKRDAIWDIVIAASKDKGKTWKRTKIGDDCGLHMVPNVALDPTTGQLHVAWYDSLGGGRFAHAVCPAGAATCKEIGRINDAPFAAFSTERHGTKWIGEYETLLIDDKRRTLHAVWTQPVDENGKAIARVFYARAKLPAR